MFLHRIRPAALAIALLAVLAACGGGSAVVPTARLSAPPSAAATQPDPTDPVEATEEATAATDEPVSTGGVVNADQVCIVTAAEAGQILGVAGVVAGPPYTGSTACSYVAGGDPVALAQFNPDNRSFFEIVRDASGVQTVDGLGVEALWDPSTATLWALKGAGLYSIVAGTGADAEAQRLAWAKQFATIALTRMP